MSLGGRTTRDPLAALRAGLPERREASGGEQVANPQLKVGQQ
jgi:hypothetical protein